MNIIIQLIKQLMDKKILLLLQEVKMILIIVNIEHKQQSQKNYLPSNFNVGGVETTNITITILKLVKAARLQFRTAKAVPSTTNSRKNQFALNVFRACSTTRITTSVFPALPSTQDAKTVMVGIITTLINQRLIVGSVYLAWPLTTSKRSV